MTRVVRRPRPVSGALAVGGALAAVASVANAPAQLAAVGVSLAGVALLALGVAVFRRGARVVGASVGLLGVLASFGALGVGLALTTAVTQRAELVGLLGVPVLALGVVPLRRRVARRLVSTGVAFVVVGTVLSAATSAASVPASLASLVCAVVAWDAGERAVNLGDQLGADARTWPVELAHSGWSAAVGGASVGLALALFEMDVTGVPIAGLVLLLAAAVTLMVVLYR
ncbi:DUF7519 family protein [Halomarina ordinaria]|uniref:MFS transporter n=1 Tax=Halomarina ordinaria TaxID=3033939 RepID=A0ABD5UDK3_9EURY|nr:hypothetical protein [Halomarina sp. PSRA2]